MTLKTTDGFWRSFDRDHEALPAPDQRDGLTTTHMRSVNTGYFTCGTCGMPCHLEHHEMTVPALVSVVDSLDLVREPMHLWVTRHGPAPYSLRHRLDQLRGTTPVIELPDATAMVDTSGNHRRHLAKRTRPSNSGSVKFGYPECGIVNNEIYVLRLGVCWRAPACDLCLKLVT